MNPDQIPPVPPVPVTAPVSTPPSAPAFAPRPAAATRESVILSSAAPRRGHGKMIAAVVAIVILAALGATYAWAYRGAETVLPNAARALADAGTAHVAATFDVTADDGDTTYTLSVDLEGDVDKTDPENPRARFTLDAEFDGMLMGGEFRYLDDAFYMKVSKLPGVALADDPSVQAMVNQWFFISKEEMETLSGEVTEVETPSAKEADPEAALGALIDAGALTFSSPKLKSVDGEMVREYDVEVDTEKLADVTVAEMRELATTTETQALVDGIEPTLREMFGATTFEKLTVRLALVSGELRAIEGKILFDGSKIDQTALAAETNGDLMVPEEYIVEENVTGTVEVEFSVAYTRYGEPVTIDVPTGATSILGLMGATDVGYDMETPPMGEDGEIWLDEGVGDTEEDWDYSGMDEEESVILVANAKSALASARAHAEVYYDANGSYQGFCGSWDGIRIATAIGKFGPDRSCVDSPTAYAYSAIFIDGEAWCVDSTGANVRVAELPAGTSCL